MLLIKIFNLVIISRLLQTSFEKSDLGDHGIFR